MGKFSTSLNVAATSVSNSLKEVAKDAATELAQRIKESTPFRTGRAAAHWEVRTDDNFVYDPNKVGDPNSPVTVSGDFVPGQKIIIGNAAPYAVILEENGSTSVSPRQMVAMNLEFWDDIVKKASSKNGF